jgi:ABC-type uncharacterized transport system substrate-binding protein
VAISELSAKRLALLNEAVPDVRAVAVLWNADDLGMTLRYRAAEVEAKRLGMQIVPLGVQGASPADLPLELPTRFDLAVNLETAKTTTTAAVAARPSWKSVTCIARKQ